MTASRQELHGLGRRMLCRALLGAAALYALAVELAAVHGTALPSPTDGFFCLVAGIGLGALLAVRQKQRVGADLLELRRAEDSCTLGVPFLFVAAMSTAAAPALAPAALGILAARAVTLLQEIATLAVVRRALTRPAQSALPRIKSLVRSSRSDGRSPASALDLWEDALERIPTQTRPLALPAGVELRSVAIATASRCPVCATEIESASVRCLDCATPHHEECFRYNRECGLYACGGSSASAPSTRRTARAA